MTQEMLLGIIFTIFICVFIALVFIVLNTKKRCKIDKNLLIEELNAKNETLNSLNDDLQDAKTNENTLKNELFQIQQSLALQTQAREIALQNNAELKKDYEKRLLDLEQKYTQNLQNLEEKLMQNYKVQNELFLSKNTQNIQENSTKTLKEIFMPIALQMQKYEKSLNEQKGAFENGFKMMVNVSQNLGKKADELALTLKGEKKIRGNFGEIMLKSVLESSGLIQGEHFFLQKHFKLSDGGVLIPDAVVYFDKNRCVMIDSKFSLGDSEDEICNNLKSRIDELSKKNYADLISGAYEYVILFVPYQNIIDIALQNDENLYQYAYDKKIILASANVLFMGLKSILMGWNYQKQNDSVVKIFDDFAKFYDKFVGVIEDFENIKKTNQKMFDNIEKLDKKLISGRGNISKQIDDLKNLGVKTKKTLSVEYNEN